MTDAALKRMTADEFLIWRLDQEGTWELVDGVPVLKFDNGPEMMSGGRRHHAYVVANLLSALMRRLEDGPCMPVSGDLAVRMVRGNMRQPDIVVECGQGSGDDLEASEPTVLFEVLSPSTRRFDLVLKTNEYQQLPDVRHFALIEPDRPEIVLWSRDEAGGWLAERIAGLDAALALTALKISIPLVELYRKVQLNPG